MECVKDILDMKYIDAYKLKNELESIYDNMLKRIKIDKDNSDYWGGKADAYRNVIDTITSLQHEQSDFPTTDEEVERFLDTHPRAEVPEKYKTPDRLFNKQDYYSHPISSEDTLSVKQEQPEQPIRGYDEAYLNEKIAKATKSWKGVDVDKFMDEVRGREPDKDLEEAAKKYATEWHENPDGSAWKPYFEVSAIKAFIAGAKWQAEQDDRDVVFWKGMRYAYDRMKEDAVEGEVVKDISNKLVVTAKINLDGFKFGDKVKLIVVKED